MKRTLLSILAFLAFTSSLPAEEVYFFRGGFDVFSRGMDQMANELKSKKINASSQSFMGWQAIANDIVSRSREKRVSYPIILVGHSFGADAVVEFANFLGRNGITTELLVGFDATGKGTLKNGAKRVVNYQSSKIGPFVKGPGFRGTLSNVDVSNYGVNHFTIAQTAEIQSLAFKEILSKVGSRRR